MKVAELIAELQKMPQDLEVHSEGCDCDGDVNAVVIDEWSPTERYVYLKRTST